MNALFEAPARETKRIVLHDDQVAGNANKITRNQNSPMPLWLKARARTKGFGHDALERTHWKKVSRSMVWD